jgi:hypothetical protein
MSISPTGMQYFIYFTKKKFWQISMNFKVHCERKPHITNPGVQEIYLHFLTFNYNFNLLDAISHITHSCNIMQYLAEFR